MILALADTGSAAAIARIQALNVHVITLAGDNPHTDAPQYTVCVAAPAPAHRRRRRCRLGSHATHRMTRRTIWSIAAPAWDAALDGRHA